MSQCVIDRRRFLKRLGLAGAAIAAQKNFGLPIAASGRKPNIVIILSDDVGYGDLTCYGGVSVNTPHIDGLAQSGLRFTDAHCAAATCSLRASRSSRDATPGGVTACTFCQAMQSR